MDGVDRAERYVQSVLAGSVSAPQTIKLACQRHQNDLARDDIFFHREAASAAIDRIESLPHAKGRWQGKPIHLEDFQCFAVASVFGWKKTADRLRRFRYFYFQLPRKNGKTLLALCIMLVLFGPDMEPGAEVYLGAQSEGSAKELLFGPAKYIVDSCDEYREAHGIETAHSSIYIPANFSRMMAVIKKPGDGYNPHAALCDEYHEADTDEQWSTFDTGMGSRDQPLLMTTTTAGFSTTSPCKQMRDDCVKMLEGTIEDDSTFALIYEPDPDDDWQDPEVLRKVNPNIGVSVSEDYLLDQLARARRSALLQNAFKTKHLNTWCGSRSAFFNMVAVQRQKHNFKLKDFEGEECHIGLDLASKKDLCSAVLVFRRGTEYYAFNRNWCSEDEANERIDYRAFVDGGSLELTPGNQTDYAYIEDKILDWAKRFQIKSLAFDPFQAAYLITRLQAMGLPCVEYPNTIKNMSDPMKRIDALILDGKLWFERGNKCMDWQMSCCESREDAKENVFPRKAEDGKAKIDAVVALIFAMGRWGLEQHLQGSYLERQDIVRL